MDGCPCGGGNHPPDSHLWTWEHVQAAARRSKAQIKRDRTDPSCPLYGVGVNRGSEHCVWHYQEIQAYLVWICRDGGVRRAS